MYTKKNYYTIIGLVIGIVLVINILNETLYTRLDFTADGRYSLSDATKGILDELTAPVTITAYFSENLPPDVERSREDLRDMLIEYANYSGGMIVYDFVDPNSDQQIEMKAQQAGVRPVMINVREKDQMKQQKAYLGVVLQYEDESDVIPLVRPGTPLEYQLSSSIKKIATTDKPKVAFLKGNGEPALSEMQQLQEALSVTHDMDEISFTDTSGVPNEYSTLAIIAPEDTIPPQYIHYLDDFIKRGGNLVIALNRVKGILTEAKGAAVNTGLNKWLNKFGIDVKQNFVIDEQCSSIMVTQQQGMFRINTPVQFPYLPIVTNFAKDNPITAGLESVMFPFVSTIDYQKADTTLHITPLAFSSQHSGVETPPLYFNVTKKWKRSDFELPEQVLAISVEGKLLGNNKSKMILFGDGDFVVNGSGQKMQKLQDDNINLMVNAIDWLSDNTGLNVLRTKAVTSRPIDKTISDSTKTIIKYVNFLLPIILLILYGFFRFQSKKKLRKKLAAIDYEE